MPQEPNRYFDNATTSYPKPEEMKRVLAHFYDVPVGSYGRSADEATLSITLKVEELRDRLAAWLGVSEASHILFCENATFGLNAILKGYKPLRKPGSIVWISPMEHNAVMRPLTASAQEAAFLTALCRICRMVP
nr:aminotransferase class V-fold PLP-dependent enzyme [Porphyromonas macacae]